MFPEQSRRDTQEDLDSLTIDIERMTRELEGFFPRKKKQKKRFEFH